MCDNNKNNNNNINNNNNSNNNNNNNSNLWSCQKPPGFISKWDLSFFPDFVSIKNEVGVVGVGVGVGVGAEQVPKHQLVDEGAVKIFFVDNDSSFSSSNRVTRCGNFTPFGPFFEWQGSFLKAKEPAIYSLFGQSALKFWFF